MVDFAELLKSPETDRIERTTTTSNTDKFSQAVCAFANDLPNHKKPGYLLIGVRDNGSLDGLRVTDQLLQNLAALRSDGNIQPLPVIHISKHESPEGDVAIVEVVPSDLPPVRYKGQIWVRIGPRRGVASEQEERRLSEKRISNSHSFDVSPCQLSAIKDLSLSHFETYRGEAIAPDVIEANHRSIEEQLASLRFFDLKTNQPTHAGILLFGKNPRYWLPGAYIQFLRIDGSNLYDPIVDQAEISGDLLSVLREVDSRLRINLRTTLSALSPLQEQTLTSYPERALRELLMNAIMHRDYASSTPTRFYWFNDRLEIQNPGGLFGEVTPETFSKVNSYRNPVIAEAMKTLGYVNRYGYGIQVAQKALKDNGNAPAEFEFGQHHVLAKVFTRRS